MTGLYSYEGRYLNQDGQLSSYNFLEDRDYYQKYSYVVKIDESLNKYRQSLKDLIHPAGMKLFGEYLSEDNNETNVENEIYIANTSYRTGVNTNSLVLSLDAVQQQIDNTGNSWYNDANTQQYANISNSYYTGGGFQFDSGDDTIIMPHTESLNVSNALTVISWFYQDKANSQYKTIVSKANAGKTRGFEFFSQNNHLEVIVWPITTNNILSYSNTVNANTWHCAAFTYDGSHVRGYLNGAFVDITPGISNSATDTANSLYIGSRSDS
ncbi:LamG domain-containing protein, partial [bacterium]|nr:LamG domain-containing protein [bacterium]